MTRFKAPTTPVSTPGTKVFKTGHLDDPRCPARLAAETSGTPSVRDYRREGDFFLGLLVDLLKATWATPDATPPTVDHFPPPAPLVRKAAHEFFPQAHRGLRDLLTLLGGPDANWRLMQSPKAMNNYLSGSVSTWGLTLAIRTSPAEVLLHVRPRMRVEPETPENRLAAIHVATVWLDKVAAPSTRLIVAELGMVDGQAAIIWDGPIADLRPVGADYQAAFQAASTGTQTRVGMACADCPLRGTCTALPVLDSFFTADRAPRYGTRVTGSRIPDGGSCPSRLLGENALRFIQPPSPDSPASALGRVVHNLLANRHGSGMTCAPGEGISAAEVALAEDAGVSVDQVLELVTDHAQRCPQVLTSRATLIEPAFVFYDPTGDVTAHIEPDAVIADPNQFVIVDHKTTHQTIPEEHLHDWVLGQWPVVSAYLELAHRGAVQAVHEVNRDTTPRGLTPAGLAHPGATRMVVIDLITAEGGQTVTFDATAPEVVAAARRRLTDGAGVLTSSLWKTQPAPTECRYCTVATWCEDRYANSTKSA